MTVPDRTLPRAVPLRVRRNAVAGIVLIALVFCLGAVALLPAVSHQDLGVDRQVARERHGWLTAIAIGLTAAAQEIVGLAALAIGVVVLWLRRHRYAAVRLIAIAGGSWVFALIVKVIIDRARPPAALAIIPPDPTGSFPSGHTTTAAVIVVIVNVILLGLPLIRRIATGVAILYALAVGVSRVYLGDHYPTDVLGSYLTVIAAVACVAAVAELPAVRRLAARALRSPAIAPRHTPAITPTGDPSGESSPR